MGHSPLEALNHLVAESIEAKLFPGVEILFAQGEEVLLHRAWGTLESGIDAPLLQTNTLFDLASLSKPLVTAPLLMLLQEEGLLDIEEPLAAFFSEFDTEDKQHITLKHLLTHTSGLPGWTNLYEGLTPESEDYADAFYRVARDRLLAVPLQNLPGQKTVYSCLGFLLLGEVILQLRQKRIPKLFEETFATPLKLCSSYYSPAKRKQNQTSIPTIAPTAYCPLRQKLLRGVVHDENNFAFKEEGGNAGLFSTASDLHRFCRMFLNEGKAEDSQIISKNSIQSMFHNYNPKEMDPRALGWDKKVGGGYWSCGRFFPEGSVGHTGFTGTSIWMDPVSKVLVIILSNRVHFERTATLKAMANFRPKVHDLLMSF